MRRSSKRDMVSLMKQQSTPIVSSDINFLFKDSANAVYSFILIEGTVTYKHVSDIVCICAMF